MFKGYRVLAIAACALLTACDTNLPSEGGKNFSPTGYAEPLSEAEFEALPPAQQYQVASKLLGTMFKGIPVEDFLDIDKDLSDPELKTPNSKANFLQGVRDALHTDLSNDEVASTQQRVLDGTRYYYSDYDDSPSAKEEPLAFIHETPLSRNSFIRWMADFLANTIMFSPAEEMESTFNTDVRRVYKLLMDGLTENRSVRQIIRSQLPSLQRWRVARTPENVGVESFELYLGLFDKKDDTVKVGTACQDFYLLGADDGYLLETTNMVNTEPQVILKEDTDGDGKPDRGGYYITTCNDFYDVIAGHPLVIPRACEVIINYLMAERTLDDRLAMCESIASNGATTFEDIFEGILFSKQYLLHTERPKGFEETFMPALDKLKWDARQTPYQDAGMDIWRHMASDTGNRLYMGNMGWNTMTLKIGRTPNVPLDALGFANYHKAIREELLLRDDTFDGGNGFAGLFYGADGSPRPQIQSMDAENFVHFLFLTALQRPASNAEIKGLMPLINSYLETTNGRQTVIDGQQGPVSNVVFDYISRLPEFYYFKSV